MKRNCRSCIWFDQCGTSQTCSYYDPVDDELQDEQIEKMIERGRRQYAREYMVYANQYSDDEQSYDKR